MIRHSLLAFFTLGLIVLSVRRWYWGLCGLVLLTVVVQHPSFPSGMMGIQGLNPWNAVLLAVMFGFVINRYTEPSGAPPSRLAVGMLAAYVAMVVASGLAALGDFGPFYGTRPTTGTFLVDSCVNPLKYVTVGVLFFMGARTRERVRLALLCAAGSGLIYAFMVYKTIRLRVFTIDFHDARRLTDKLVGLFANDMAELLAFSIWSGLIVCVLFRQRWLRVAWIGMTLTSVPVFLALKSRAGYLACAAIALVLGAVRWRRLLLLFPIVIVAVVIISPSVLNRITMGMSEHEDTDWDTVSAGRTTYLWPASLEQIAREPLFGSGRMTIKREAAVYERILELGGRVPAHPHNSYLEVLMDAGIVGLLIVLAVSGGLLVASARLLRSGGDPVVRCAGACGVCAIIAELAAGVAGSSFWPGQSEVPYMVVWGAVLAIGAERRAAETRAVRRRPVAARDPSARSTVVEGGGP